MRRARKRNTPHWDYCVYLKLRRTGRKSTQHGVCKFRVEGERWGRGKRRGRGEGDGGGGGRKGEVEEEGGEKRMEGTGGKEEGGRGYGERERGKGTNVGIGEKRHGGAPKG